MSKNMDLLLSVLEVNEHICLGMIESIKNINKEHKHSLFEDYLEYCQYKYALFQDLKSHAVSLVKKVDELDELVIDAMTNDIGSEIVKNRVDVLTPSLQALDNQFSELDLIPPFDVVFDEDHIDIREIEDAINTVNVGLPQIDLEAIARQTTQFKD